MQQISSQPWRQPLTQPQSVQITPRVEGVFDLCPYCRSVCTGEFSSCRNCGRQRHPSRTFLDGEFLELRDSYSSAVRAAPAVQSSQGKQALALQTVVEESRVSVEGLSSYSSYPKSICGPASPEPSESFDKCQHCHDTYRADALFCQRCGQPREYDSEGNELIFIQADYLSVTDPEKKAKLEEVKAKLSFLLGQESMETEAKPAAAHHGASPEHHASDMCMSPHQNFSPNSTFAVTSVPDRHDTHSLDDTCSMPWEEMSPILHGTRKLATGAPDVADSEEECQLRTLVFSGYPAAPSPPEPRYMIDHGTMSETVSLEPEPTVQQSNDSGDWLEWLVKNAWETDSKELHFIRHDWNIDDTHFAPQLRSWPEKHNESITGSAIPALPSADELLHDSSDPCVVMPALQRHSSLQ
eukprot:s2100_g11.t1